MSTKRFGLSFISGILLRNNGTEVDLGFIRTASLLHDIGRFTFPPGEGGIKHGIRGTELLIKEGIDRKYAQVCEKHIGSGITADDIIKYDLKKHIINLEQVDLSRIKQLANYAWFKNNKAWQRQFKMMKDFKAKAEIQAMSSKGITFISDKYLPEKVKNKDWLD